MTERLSSRWAALWVMAEAFPWRTGVLALLCGLTGLAPGVFALAVGGIVAAVPGAALDGLNSPAGYALGRALGVAAAALLLGEVLDLGLGLHTDTLYRKLDEAVLTRVMRACLAPAGIGHLEDPAQQQRVSLALRAARYGPGEFVSGISAKWRARAGGIVATLLVAQISLPAAVGLGVIWVVVGIHLSGAHYRGEPIWTEPLKRALYLRDMGLEAPAAKEVRLFGLADWLVGRYTAAWQEVVLDLWAARRVDFRRTTALAVVLTAGYAAVFLWAVQAALAGQLTLGQLAVMMQAALAMTGLGSLDGDVWVENGAVPVPSVLALERELAVPPRPKPAAPPRATPAGAGIRFESVTFAYPHVDRPILDRLDLRIPMGRSLALVGDNGAGKTTLLKLLLGLYGPGSGRVPLDGVPLDQVYPDPADWRARTGVIFQDFQRYELSALDNIGFGAIGHLASETGPGSGTAGRRTRRGARPHRRAAARHGHRPLAALPGWGRALRRAVAATGAGARALRR